MNKYSNNSLIIIVNINNTANNDNYYYAYVLIPINKIIVINNINRLIIA